MTTDIHIRPAGPADYEAIASITAAAFAPKAFSTGTEGPILTRLRARGEDRLELVAEQDGSVVGAIMFSDVTGVGDNIVSLGPVSVRPDKQGEGIGGALVREGLQRIRASGARACVLIGDPNYYARFGFIGDCGLTYGSVPIDRVMTLVWSGPPPRGEIVYASAFND